MAKRSKLGRNLEKSMRQAIAHKEGKIALPMRRISKKPKPRKGPAS